MSAPFRDSFMVTTTSSLDALRFALDLQLTFQDYYWDWVQGIPAAGGLPWELKL